MVWFVSGILNGRNVYTGSKTTQTHRIDLLVNAEHT